MKSTAAAAALFVSLSASATSLDTFVGALGGQGNSSIPGGCTTFGPPAELRALFPRASFAVPLGGIDACNYAGGYRVQTRSSNTLADAYALAPVPLNASGATFSGNGAAIARYGALGASAHAQIDNGLGGPTNLYESIGAARFTDTLTASSPLVAGASQGYVRYRFSIDGSLTSLGPAAAYHYGVARAEMQVQQDNGPLYTPFAALQYRGSDGTVLNGTPPPGWSTSTGSLSGASTVYSDLLPMQWNQSWGLTVSLFAWAYGTADAQFLATTRLTGIELFDANRNAVTDFSLSAASGTNYLLPVPEPSVAGMLLAGLALLAVRARRKIFA